MERGLSKADLVQMKKGRSREVKNLAKGHTLGLLQEVRLKLDLYSTLMRGYSK